MSTGTHTDIWVLAEHREARLLDVTFEMLEDARKLVTSLKEKVVALILGSPELPDLSHFLAGHGADQIFVIRHPFFEIYRTGVFVQVLAKLCEEHQPSNFILPATPNGQDLAARLAARLGVGLVSFCLKLQIGKDGVVEGVREVYGKKAYATVACCGKRPHIFTFKPGAAGVGTPDKKRTAEVTELPPLEIDEHHLKTRVLEFIPSDPHAIDLPEADMIVAGGGGVGTKEMFALLQELADFLGASIGGTRVAVDRGWITFDRQIGQTGKVVAPRLYIAAGISGANLHAMGIKDSDIIIAINMDKNAPIFKLAHIGAVGDVKEVLPKLITRLRTFREQKAMSGRSTFESGSENEVTLNDI